MSWLYRHRDAVARSATLALTALGGLAWYFTPHATPVHKEAPREIAIRMETPPEPAPPPPPPPPPPPAAPPPPPIAKAPPPPRAQPAPAPAPAPAQTFAQAEPAPATPPAPPAPPQPPAPVPPPPAPPAPPAPPPAARAAPSQSAEASYLGQLRGYLHEIKRYPSSREARQTRPVGTVGVWIELDRGGKLVTAGVDSSSGSMILDQEALRTVRTGTYQPFPADTYPGQNTHRFVMQLEYQLSSGG